MIPKSGYRFSDKITRKPKTLFEGLVVVIRADRHAGALWRGWRSLQELRRVACRLATFVARRTRGALGRVAANLALQRDDIREDVGLPAQLIGYHWRLGGDR